MFSLSSAQNPQPDQNGTITYAGPAGEVVRVDYAMNLDFANKDCVFLGTVTSM